MIKTYYEIGRRIVEQEQQGKEVANYGDYILVRLSESLSGSFGKGFSKRNLELMRQFYLTYRIAKSPISQSLSWTHYIRLMRISDPDERRFYEIEAANNNWSVRELNRQFDSALYQRLALSRDKEAVKELAIKGQTIEKPEDILKDPYVLEFTGLPELPQYTESKLEQRLWRKHDCRNGGRRLGGGLLWPLPVEGREGINQRKSVTGFARNSLATAYPLIGGRSDCESPSGVA